MENRRKAAVAALIYAGILSVVVHFYINAVQPDAYMDEIFHEEQTLTYLRGDWTHWNPKITTPPALYALTTAVWRLLSLPANVAHFRFLNCVIAGVNLFILAELSQNTLGAIAVASLPVLTFTGLIFYTDQLSLCAILLTYAARQKSWPLSFIAGVFACCVRQTNVVFIAFMIGQEIVRRLAVSLPGQSSGPVECMSRLIRSPSKLCRTLVGALFQDAPHLTAVIALFVALTVLFNGGEIVLGDKTAHQPVLHVAQILYFFAFCAAHTPLAFVNFISRFRNRRFSLLWTSLALALTAFIIHNFTIEHLYLLSDNRHYTFYAWSKFFRRYPLFRYLVSPFYVLAGRYVAWGLSNGPCSTVDLLTTLGFLICTAMALIPAGLIELRYFIAPYVIWRLIKPRDYDEARSRRNQLAEIAMNLLVNAVTIYIFVYHPFRWLSQPFTWQRFMW